MYNLLQEQGGTEALNDHSLILTTAECPIGTIQKQRASRNSREISAGQDGDSKLKWGGIWNKEVPRR